ncbi:DUF134 domain-containing protein [Marinilabiliaceae bacterium ANBcel2]|nr:DUF134 domain-containing protein [Marinilabiliaceae bacterium ANBcel2]
MPRPVRLRKVVAPPGFDGYKPYGALNGEMAPVELFYEEYEALKLSDYDNYDHLTACRLMGVSRATFARIYERARRKIAKAFVETREIKSIYGNASLDADWYCCTDCNARFSEDSKEGSFECALCGSDNVREVGQSEVNNKLKSSYNDNSDNQYGR